MSRNTHEGDIQKISETLLKDIVRVQNENRKSLLTLLSMATTTSKADADFKDTVSKLVAELAVNSAQSVPERAALLDTFAMTHRGVAKEAQAVHVSGEEAGAGKTYNS
jgi:hypothetical protein